MLLKMNINHFCPKCGKVRFAYLGAGWVRRDILTVKHAEAPMS